MATVNIAWYTGMTVPITLAADSIIKKELRVITSVDIGTVVYEVRTVGDCSTTVTSTQYGLLEDAVEAYNIIAG